MLNDILNSIGKLKTRNESIELKKDNPLGREIKLHQLRGYFQQSGNCN